MRTPTSPQQAVTVRVFVRRFAATRLGARTARLAAVGQLADWGVARDTDVSDVVSVIVGELTANAATHGKVPGRDFELRLLLGPGTLCVEVSDTRGEVRPPCPGEIPVPAPESESGRGMVLVAALADRWSVTDRVPVGKTVRAEVDL
ncbi:ATP-binding protein [Streptomyces sp. NPDC014894]|uniref:ATP-binding protein n=1 Tax=unclassified Streptomyces TaxID=2593676 RepID=UPI0036F8B83F